MTLQLRCAHGSTNREISIVLAHLWHYIVLITSSSSCCLLMNLQNLFKTVGYKVEFVWAVTVIPLGLIQESATPLCQLWEIYGNVLASVRASLLVCYLEYSLFGGSAYISYIGGSASVKARQLDRGVHYLECPLHCMYIKLSVRLVHAYVHFPHLTCK